jgi:hypothetical protein
MQMVGINDTRNKEREYMNAMTFEEPRNMRVFSRIYIPLTCLVAL